MEDPTKERIYQAVLKYWLRYQLPPTLREIGYLAGVSSTSVVAYNLAALQREKRVEVAPGKTRGVRLVGATWSPPPGVGT